MSRFVVCAWILSTMFFAINIANALTAETRPVPKLALQLSKVAYPMGLKVSTSE